MSEALFYNNTNSQNIQQRQYNKNQQKSQEITNNINGGNTNDHKNQLDQSVSAASADSSMIKSWISIKDLKQMVNPQGGNSQNSQNVNQNLRKSKIKQPTIIGTQNNQELQKNKEDYPLQLNSKRNLNAPLQVKSEFLQQSTTSTSSQQNQESEEKLKKQTRQAQSTLKTARLQNSTSQAQLNKQQLQNHFQNSHQANKENRSIDKQPQQLFKKQTMFRNQSFVKSQTSIDKANAQVNMKLKQLEIDICDQNDMMLANDSMLLAQNDDNQMQNQGINNSVQLNCILDTYDKDYEQFQEHLDKMKQHLQINTGPTSTSNSGRGGKGELGDSQYHQSQNSTQMINSKRNANRSVLQDKQFESQSNLNLTKSQNSIYQERDHYYNPITTEAVCSPKILIQNIESKKTTKRNSDMNSLGLLSNQESSYRDISVKITSTQQSNLQSKRIYPTLKDCNSQGSLESTIQTERRDDAKLVIKLKNDIELLNELLQEEKDKNNELYIKLETMQNLLENQADEKQTMIEKIESLEFQLQEVSTELLNTKDYYEEMIHNMQYQLQQSNKENEQMENIMNQFSKIQQNTNNTESFKLSCDMSKGQDQTLQELSNQFNQHVSNKEQQSKQFDKLKKLVNNVSYQNKSNNFSMSSQKKDYATIKLNKVQESNEHNETSINNSNILMTSECKKDQQHQSSDISASLSQYDNQNVKFLKYVNKSKLVDMTNTSQFGRFSTNQNNISNSGYPSRKKQGFKLSKMMNQSSIVEGDDSVICEEANVNVNNIKAGNFNIKKLDDLAQSTQQNMINIQDQYVSNDYLEASPIEDQINSLLHQIDGHLLTQSVEMMPPSSRRGGGMDSQFIIQGHQNLATFGGHQQVAQSLTGTQQLSLLWNNLKDDERDFYSKRISINQQIEEDHNAHEGGFTGFNIQYDEDGGLESQGNQFIDSQCMSSSQIDEEQLQLWIQAREKEQQQQMFQNIEISLAKFRDVSK